MIIFPIIYNDEQFKLLTEKEVDDVDPGRYLVSNYGRIFDIKSNRYVSLCYYGQDVNSYIGGSVHTKSGYKRILVHRLVAMLFVPGDISLTVNHKDGFKPNISYHNLEWITQRDNLIHAVETGLNYKGEDKINAILTNEQVHMICRYLEDGYNYDQILKLIPDLNNIQNIKRILVDIKRHKSWTFISKNYNIPDEKVQITRSLTNEQVHTICKLLSSNQKYSYKELMDITGVDPNIINYERFRHIIYSIKNKDAYTNISKFYNL